MSSPERRSHLRLVREQAPNPVVPESVLRMTTASWETTAGQIELRTNNNPRLHTLFINDRRLVHKYYDAIYKRHITGREIRNSHIVLEAFIPDREDFPPIDSAAEGRMFFPSFEVIAKKSKTLSPILRIVRETVTGKIEKRTIRSKKSQGFRKHIREEKAAKSRAERSY